MRSARPNPRSGAINSWDREPYSWRSWDPTDVSPLPMLETRNFIINNYNGVWVSPSPPTISPSPKPALDSRT